MSVFRCTIAPDGMYTHTRRFRYAFHDLQQRHTIVAASSSATGQQAYSNAHTAAGTSEGVHIRKAMSRLVKMYGFALPGSHYFTTLGLGQRQVFNNAQHTYIFEAYRA